MSGIIHEIKIRVQVNSPHPVLVDVWSFAGSVLALAALCPLAAPVCPRQVSGWSDRLLATNESLLVTAATGRLAGHYQ